MASNQEIKAVRKVLYDRDRKRQMKVEIGSIELLMNLDPGEAIPPDDARVEPGAGPIWFVPATGAVSPAVLEAADRCDRLAAILMKTREALADVDFDRSDKDDLRAALKAQAKAMRMRADIWREPGAPDPETATQAVMKHEAEALRRLRRVEKYLKGVA